MARKAAEEAWGRQFAYLVAADPEKKAHCQAFFDNALQTAGAKHLTLNTADPGVLVERLEQRAKAQASKGAGGQQEQGLDVTTGQELLREAAWLAAGQHGFAALAGIPELQQIISHTCLPALQHYGCLLDDWQHSEAEYVQRQKTELDQTQGPLLHHLCPQLRLCLLAEVAAGLLVPGHPLPPDTIEHAAALYAFIDEASNKLADEIFCQPQFYNGCSSRSGGCYSSGDQRKLDKAVTCLLHGLEVQAEALEQLALVRRLVLDLALRRCKLEAAEAGIDLQQSSNLLHGCGKQEFHQRAAAVKKGMTALWNLIRKMSLEVGGPLETHLKASNSQQMHQAFSSLSLGAALGAAGSSSSSSSDGAAVDDASFRAGCKLCQLEKQQQQQQHASAGSSSSTAEQPGDAADPFMWRRLLWRLVGRIKPTARRLFAAEKGMCPHSDNTYMWHELISSLKLHLWVAPGDEAGLGRLLLCKPTLEAHLLAQPRSFFVRHFARAANLAFAQGYSCPAAPLLSHQVLLALSPLHRHQLPQPELAPLLPSSFGPVVARVLSQQLGLGGCLREFEHEAAGQPAMWHVWWHIGLRRYHWQQQQQGDWPAAGTSSSSSSSSGLSRLSPEQLEALYSDPAAKYYAVGFASRQLCPDVTWQAPSAIRSSSSSSSSSSRQLSTMQGLASQLLAACKLTYTHILHSHSKPADSSSPNSQASSSSSGAAPAAAAAAAAAAAEALSELQFDRIAVCKDVADALQQRPSGGAVQSSLHDDLEGLFDPEFDHDFDLDLEPGLNRAANSPVMLAIRRQQEKLLLACAGTGSGGGLREILAAACGAADAASGMAAAALLAPAPAEVWLAPAAWCHVRSMLMRDDMCSECGEVPGKRAARLLELAGWQTMEHGVQAADSCCADCGAFFFCCEQCAGKGWHWHRSLCKALTAVRKRYQRLPPVSHSSSLQHAALCTTHSSSSSSSSSGGGGGGYQWPVMQLLQQGAGSCQASQVPLDEPGPFGLNCCGLLHSRHPHEMSLVGSPHRVLHAHKQSDRLSGEYMSGKAMMLAAIAMHRTGMHEDAQRRGLPPFFESFDLL
ncbi:hypothetical protein OEZ85_000661 [Tetradesmus obliquus]|uniref:MYND-type domain-containing protein n=1 Tax=Tetradesmus obliquus TaxID=3088 RepID=A0ABY8UPB0_TETOB|nr:hypothetical protein OEZ85_000661 [Tetradesmus obliquus]